MGAGPRGQSRGRGSVSDKLTKRPQRGGMVRWVFAALVLVLMGCNTPGPSYRGIAPTRVSVAGSTFDVRQRGLWAEAIRVNPQYAPRFGPIRDRAATAMARVSGCEVVSVSGDQALATGRLDCGAGPPPKPARVTAFDCIPVRGSEIREIGQIRVDLDCDPA